MMRMGWRAMRMRMRVSTVVSSSSRLVMWVGGGMRWLDELGVQFVMWFWEMMAGLVSRGRTEMLIAIPLISFFFLVPNSPFASHPSSSSYIRPSCRCTNQPGNRQTHTISSILNPVDLGRNALLVGWSFALKTSVVYPDATNISVSYQQ